MGLTRRILAGNAEVTSISVANAINGASEFQINQIKSKLDISGFSYSGSGFVFYGDGIQSINSTGKNIYQLDGGTDE